MLQPMSSLELYSVVCQMQDLCGKRIEKLKMVREGVYEVQLGNSWLIIDLSFGAFLGPSYDWQEDGWCAAITQMVKDKRIDRITQAGLDRILRIDAGDVCLVVELFGGGNILVLKDGIIHRVLKPRQWKGRTLAAGNPYQYPETLVKLPESSDEFLKVSPSILVGKKYAEACKDWASFRELLEMASKGMGTLVGEEFRIGCERPISRVIYEFYTKIAPKLWENEKAERIKGTIAKHKKIIAEFDDKSKEYREKGNYIYDHLQTVDSALELIKSGKWPVGVDIKRRARYMVTLELDV